MWVKVAKTAEIPEGGAVISEANGEPIALFKVEAKLYALCNTCPHQGGPLGEGYLDGQEVTCPWHAWVFNVKTGDCSSVPDVKQKTYPVKTESGNVLIEI
ncbi:MAG: Rieske 2Fe-2S domain-containing protein [Candidatus Omnitrophica bacterium]|nr:Rieske 2Fe-2S domain-containing protein [Candidatus Omnitrophota bacterium]